MSLEHKTSALIMCVAQEMKTEIARVLKPTGLSFPQLMLLHTLDAGPENGLTVNQLKQLMVDESPNVSRAVSKLADAGLVIKQRNEQDQRVVHIRITDAGRQAHKEGDTQFDQLTLGLSNTDLQQLYSLLAKI